MYCLRCSPVANVHKNASLSVAANERRISLKMQRTRTVVSDEANVSSPTKAGYDERSAWERSNMPAMKRKMAEAVGSAGIIGAKLENGRKTAA